ncbi:T9SS C-terminal target domain-containing protein [Sphingobacteriales bacterium UPWRP_1]|nr:hypothetical protein B6N25_11685 [Sphingobacteriales bacterium TSM_CSS]PSJ72614.1 T9SS C-terminal target domain-containing protein [Sphingobacteriales bacterium UPWRP_1]
MVQTISYLQSNLLAEAKTETEARNDTEGDKTLVATYTDERNLAKADSLLQTLPQETPEGAAFYYFFNAYIDELQSNTDLLPYDGKAPSQAALQIQNMAASTNLNNNAALFAQTVFAAQQNGQYRRTPTDEKALQVPYSHSTPTLRLIPNPAQNEVYIWIDAGTEVQAGTQLNLYSVTGKLLQTLTPNPYQAILLNTQNLVNGLYICELTTTSGKPLTSKLIISR